MPVNIRVRKLGYFLPESTWEKLQGLTGDREKLCGQELQNVSVWQDNICVHISVWQLNPSQACWKVIHCSGQILSQIAKLIMVSSIWFVSLNLIHKSLFVVDQKCICFWTFSCKIYCNCSLLRNYSLVAKNIAKQWLCVTHLNQFMASYSVLIVSSSVKYLTSERVLPTAGGGLLALLLPPPGLGHAVALGHVRHRGHHGHDGGAQGVHITCKYRSVNNV